MAVSPKLVRGRIVGMLAADYPKWSTAEILYLALDEIEYDTPRSRLREHLNYLRERGFVAVDEGYSDQAKAEFCRVRLSAKGKALVDGDCEPDGFVDPRGYAKEGQPV
jgi:hypothetical protein